MSVALCFSVFMNERILDVAHLKEFTVPKDLKQVIREKRDRKRINDKEMECFGRKLCKFFLQHGRFPHGEECISDLPRSVIEQLQT